MIPADRKTVGAVAEGCANSGARPSRSPMATAAASVAAATANPPTFSAMNRERRGSAAPWWIREGEGHRCSGPWSLSVRVRAVHDDPETRTGSPKGARS